MLRRKRAVLLVGLAALVAVRSRRARRRDGVTLVYGDGSALTLEAGSAAADRILELARPALAIR
jgi:hypothetical protein